MRHALTRPQGRPAPRNRAICRFRHQAKSPIHDRADGTGEGTGTLAERDLPDALLGWSGFVGGVLDAQHAFDARFRRADIHESAGRGFGTLVCAAAPGSMFAANRDPKGDAAAIDGLIAALSRVRARRMVLVSTIAVLARFDGRQDEDTADFQTETPYGANRRRLEAFCSARFDRCLILRLPALFGPGLRKNFIFDILNPVPAMLTPERMETVLDALPADLRDPMAGLYDRDDARGLSSVDRARVAALPERARLEAALVESGMSARAFTNPDSRFQFYDMGALWDDITLGLDAGLDVLHIAPEPLRAGAVHAALTGKEMPVNTAPLHREDMRTRHAELWGREGPYSASAPEVLDRLRRFHAAMRGAEADG
jgi:nucleoside-diphosphate-sugar epimerase